MYILYDKRNGNGQTTCLLCHKLTWDSFCYNFSLHLIGKELFHTIICNDCFYEIKKDVSDFMIKK